MRDSRIFRPTLKGRLAENDDWAGGGWRPGEGGVMFWRKKKEKSVRVFHTTDGHEFVYPEKAFEPPTSGPGAVFWHNLQKADELFDEMGEKYGVRIEAWDRFEYFRKATDYSNIFSPRVDFDLMRKLIQFDRGPNSKKMEEW